MKGFGVSFLFAAAASAVSIPLASIPLDSATTSVEAVTGFMPNFDITKRQADDPNYQWNYICQFVTPNTAMPKVSEALAIASYLEGLGDKACGMSRPQFSTDPVYQNLAVSGGTEINLYFTPGKSGTGIEVQYYCRYVGRYIRALVSACTKGDRIQGYTEIPNCPNLKLVWIQAAPQSEGGGSIEIMPKGTRHGKKRAVV